MSFLRRWFPRTTILATCLLLVFLRMTSATRAADDKRLPPVKALSEIEVVAGSQGIWILEIRRDGSGGLGFGAQALGTLPAATFDFAEVHRELVELAASRDAKPSVEKTPVSTSFIFRLKSLPEESPPRVLATKPEFILSLFETARSKSDNRQKERIEKLWRLQPPVNLP